MKTTLFFLTSTIIFAWLGWNVSDPQPAAVTGDQAGIVVDDPVELAGDWYSFPTGSLIRLHAGGTAEFALDTNSTAAALQATTWFVDEQWHITYINYDGEEPACHSATGIYQLQTVGNDYLIFSPIQDECQSRADLLGGNETLGHELLFHPVTQ